MDFWALLPWLAEPRIYYENRIAKLGPWVVLCLSIIFFILHYAIDKLRPFYTKIWHLFKSKFPSSKRTSSDTDQVGSFPVLTEVPDEAIRDELPIKADDGQDEENRHTSKKQSRYTEKAFIPQFMLAKDLLEMICLLLLIFLRLVKFSSTEDSNRRLNIGIAMPPDSLTVLIAYALVLATARFAAHHYWKLYHTLEIWIHSLAIYFCVWFIIALELDVMTTKGSETLDLGDSWSDSTTTAIIELAISTVLLTNILTERIDNTPTILTFRTGLLPPREKLASILSCLLFSWMDKLMWRGTREILNPDDIDDLASTEHSATLLAKVHQRFHKPNEYGIVKFRHIAWYLLSVSWKLLLATTIFSSLTGIFMFLPSYCLNNILAFIEDPANHSVHVAWINVFGIFFVIVINALTDGQALYIGRKLFVRWRAVVIGEVYAKGVRCRTVPYGDNDDDAEKNHQGNEYSTRNVERKTSNQQKPEGFSLDDTGNICNLVAVDASRIGELGAYIHYIFEAIVTMVLALGYLYKLMGWPSLVGAGFMIVGAILNGKLAQLFDVLGNKQLKVSDKRLETTSESMRNIRLIKLFGWEDRFLGNIMKYRTQEVGFIRRNYLLRALNAFLVTGTLIAVSLSSFGSYTFFKGERLTASVAFTALSLFNTLEAPFDEFSTLLYYFIQGKVSMDRVNTFLSQKDTDKYSQISCFLPSNVDHPSIGFEHAWLTWSEDGTDHTSDDNGNSGNANEFRIEDINVKFPPGEITLITGVTGSGKSSILMALLGEMNLIKGNVFLPNCIERENLVPDRETGLTDSVAYCAQAPWLQDDTIRNNILFSSEYDEERYGQVLEDCGLTEDIGDLDDEDETIIGGKGMSLSGGQQQRIAIARALYSTAKHILLDDCLSALDPKTAQHIYDNALCGQLMKGRTRVLVAHNVGLTIVNAIQVVVVDKGKIVFCGSRQEFAKNTTLSTRFLSSSSEKKKLARSKNYGIDEAVIHVPSEQTLQLASRPKKSQAAIRSQSTAGESMTRGRLKGAVINFYFSSMGGTAYWLIVFVLALASQGAILLYTFWIREWTQGLAGGHSSHSAGFYLTVYGLLGLQSITIFVLYEGSLFWGGLNASRKLYRLVIHRLFYATCRFFDGTTIGQIMNRLSYDMAQIDMELAYTFFQLFDGCMGTLATILIVSFITPQFAIAALILAIAYGAVAYIYLCSSRELKRLSRALDSPIQQHFNETLRGVVTIRAFGDERRFIRDNICMVDGSNQMVLYLWASNRWLGIRVNLLSALVAFMASAFALLSLAKVDAGLAGLSISYALTFNGSLIKVVRLYGNTEMAMNAVERIYEYSNAEQEAPSIEPSHRPPRNWPSDGRMQVKNLKVRYRPDSPIILHGITFDVGGGQRIGIVGRSGSGKTTLLSSFFRLVEPCAGSIIIDGVDITKIGLHDLRENMAIIPQEPTLFTGSLRFNVDPASQHTDREVMNVLQQVGLLDDDRENNGSEGGEFQDENGSLGLESQVGVSGDSLSEGQKQLVCLARVLLRKPRILFLDEATASLDFHTDQAIKRTLFSLLNGVTIINVTHRISNVIDYDRVLVLERGKVVAYDDPCKMVFDTTSKFYTICQDTGDVQNLQDIAKKARHY